MGEPSSRAPISRARAGLAALLAFVYAAPLLVPGPHWAAATAIRLAALAAAAALVARPFVPVPQPAGAPAPPPAATALRLLALGVAAGHAIAARHAATFGRAGQAVYLLALFVPAALLAVPRCRGVPSAWRCIGRIAPLAPTAAVIAVWVGLRLLLDPHSPRAAHVIDTWRTSLGVAAFMAERASYLTAGFDPEMPGVPATPLFFLGLPLVEAGLAPPTFASVRVLHVASLAVTAGAVAAAARALVAPAAAPVAAAVFLFAPFTRFLALSPGPYAVSPLYAAALALAAIAAWRGRSEAALAALGSLCGLALAAPGLAPIASLAVAATAASMPGRGRAIGCATAAASFLAAVLPRSAGVLERAIEAGRSWIAERPTALVPEVLLSPFAIARTPERLWGDSLFDPIGGVLIAAGVTCCLRSGRRAPGAAILLLALAAALLPALAFGGDRPLLARALALPVPAALLAAAGFEALRRALGWRTPRAVWAAVAAVCVGGTVVFDVVNPRILGPSALAVMFRALDPATARRAILVDEASELGPDLRRLDRGPMTVVDGERVIAYLRYGNGPLPDLAADGQDLLFWSPQVERTVQVTDVVCAQWPEATLYLIGDESGRGAVHAARIGGPAWEPGATAGPRRAGRCTR